MTDPNRSPKNSNLSLVARLEALLFVAPELVYPGQLANALDVPVGDVETCLKELESLYIERGIRIQWHNGRVQLTTAPEIGDLVEHFLGLEATSRLSQAALETLAIVAYQQPVTRPQVDMIRGVNSDGVLKTLLGKGLIEEIGRADSPGRPILYKTTPDFLRYFGLNSLDDLPPIESQDEINQNENEK
ncbi:MAG: SMC-Scp complex subunit ScpB [Anaerolineales bacterium]|jgi:segregation and condensation protein B